MPVQFGHEAAQDIVDTVRQVRNMTRGSPRDYSTRSAEGPIRVRIGKTTTDSDYPTYPTGTGNTFVVTFGERTFTATPGAQTATFTAYTNAEYRYARTTSGVYVPQNTVVTCMLSHGLWWIIDAPTRYKAVTDEDIAKDTSGEVTLWLNGVATTVTLTAYVNWMASYTVKAGTEIVIQWQRDENSGAGQWYVDNGACAPTH